jgi:hypothetical protein
MLLYADFRYLPTEIKYGYVKSIFPKFQQIHVSMIV